MRKRKLWVAAAVIPLAAVGQWVAPGKGSAQTNAATQSALTRAEARALSTNVTQKVIVLLKDQVAQDPPSAAKVSARRSVESSEQSPIVSELHQTSSQDVHTYTLVNAVSATVSPGEESRLKANPSVSQVVPDQIIHLASPFTASSPTSPPSSSSPRVPIAGECPAPGAAPLLTPQALTTIGANSQDPAQKTAASLGITGAGVKVGFIADGLDINNTDFIRPDGSHVFIDYKDFSGEGTAVPTGGGEAFLDASSVAAQGRNVYDVSKYSAEPISRPCDIRVEGVSPGASLVGLDIFGAEDAGFNSSFIQAIDYAVSVDHVNVLNESLGSNFYPDDSGTLDAIKAANDAAVAAGTTVTVSSGDAGVTSTIGTPATDPNVLSVGASTTYQGEVQANYGGSQFGVSGWLNDNISSFSSGGFEQDGSTVSLVAPGELNWALCSTDTAEYSECTNYLSQPSPVQLTGGTSESAPLAAGVAALVDQAYAKTHGGTYPTPAVVKQIITSTADDISAPAQYQGSGRIDAYKAVLAAEAYDATPASGAPATILESTNQFNVVGTAGQANTLTDTLTNQGSKAVTVGLATRTVGGYTPIANTTVTLSDTASPHSVDYQGKKDNFETVNFTVPTGVARLNASVAWQGASSALAARVRLTLIDPSNRLADYDVPQGIGNYGNAQVALPEAGTWKAIIWSRVSAAGGTTGPVVFGASTAAFASFGTVSTPSVTIPAGGSVPVTVSVTDPSAPGDSAGALVITPAGQTAQTVPVTVRTLVPTGKTSFGGTLTGGNGRETVTGQTFYYQFDLPAGEPELNASVTLADNPDNATFAWLVDPSGLAQAQQSNTAVTSDANGKITATPELGTNLHVLSPAAGRWTMIVLFSPTVSGTALSEPFTVAVNQTPAKVKATGVPQGKAISATSPAVVDIKVTNSGTAPEAYFVDGRLDSLADYGLAPLNSADTTVPLSVTDNIPLYLVPSQTSVIAGTATTTGTEPIQFDLGYTSGDPDVASGQGTSVSAGVTGNPVPTGAWDIAPDTVGPFGATGATPEPVSTTLTAQTEAFDPSVTAATGDLWLASIGGPITVSPVVVQPGQSATIPVIITPTGTPGSTVSGVLYLDDDSLVAYGQQFLPNGNTVAAVPYSYTIKG